MNAVMLYLLFIISEALIQLFLILILMVGLSILVLIQYYCLIDDLFTSGKDSGSQICYLKQFFVEINGKLFK